MKNTIAVHAPASRGSSGAFGSARSRASGWLVAALIVMVPAASYAADKPIADTAMTAPVQAMVRAWNAGDGPAWGDAFWPDADSVNIYGGTLHGGAAMGARHGVVFAGRLKGTHMQSEIVTARRMGADAGIVETLQTVDPPASGDSKVERLKVFVTLVVERRRGVWKVVHVQNTRLTAPPRE